MNIPKKMMQLNLLPLPFGERLRVGLFIFCCFVFTSCKNLKEITFSGIDNVSISSFSQKGAEAVIVTTIKNPNRIGFNVYKSEMDVSIGGINAGKAQLAKKVKIKAKSEKSYTFNVKADFSKLSIEDMPKLLGMAFSNDVNVGIKGNLSVGKLFIKRTVPVNVIKKVPLK